MPAALASDPGKKHNRRNDPKQKRMLLLDRAREITVLSGLRGCGVMPLGGAVSVTLKESGDGGFAGVAKCGSVWACPECSPVVRQERAAELEQYAIAWLTGHDGELCIGPDPAADPQLAPRDPEPDHTGHGVAMATLTVRHWSRARLKPQLDGVADAWRALQQGRWWGTWRAKHGIAGVTRALEVTHSWANSWHAHIHAILWTERPVSADQARQMQTELYDRWLTLITARKLGKPTRKHGVRVDPARAGRQGAADMVKYLVKVQDKDDTTATGRALGNEMLRGDLKQGRRAGRAPFEILRRAVQADPDEDDAERDLWREYELGTKGHRMLTWGGPVRDRLRRLVPDVQERTAADVAAEEATRATRAVLLQVLPAPWTDVIHFPGRRGQLRTAIRAAVDTAGGVEMGETAARDAAADLFEAWGLRPGVDFYGPGDCRFTSDGEQLLTDHPAPAPTAARRPAHTWQTADDLTATTALLGVRPQDSARPEMARRRAAGLPVARDFRTPHPPSVSS